MRCASSTPEPREWQDDDVELLEAARPVGAWRSSSWPRSPASTPSSIARWGLAIDAAGVGSFDWDLRTGQLLWDDRLLALFGYDRTDFGRSIEDFNARLHPDDVARVSTADSAARRSTTCGTVRLGVPRRPARRRPRAGSRARGPGAVRRRRGRRAAAGRGVRHHATCTTARPASRGCWRRCPPPSSRSTTQWRFTYVNAEAERLLGRHRDELLGGVMWELFPLRRRLATSRRTTAAPSQRGSSGTFEAYYPAPLDAWYEVRAWPAPDGLSRLLPRRHRAHGRAAAGGARHPRARAWSPTSPPGCPTPSTPRRPSRGSPSCSCPSSPTGASSRSSTTTARCATSAGRTSTQASPRLTAALLRAAPRRAHGRRPTWPRRMRTGQPSVVPEDADGAHRRGAASRARRATCCAQLAPESAAILPMQARGRTVGLLSLFNGPDRARYDDGELATARDVAARAALALDNARLFEQQRQLAEQLQRSLLTPPPEPDHMQVVVRYVPAVAGGAGRRRLVRRLPAARRRDGARHRRRRRPRHRRRGRHGPGARTAARHRLHDRARARPRC